MTSRTCFSDSPFGVVECSFQCAPGAVSAEPEGRVFGSHDLLWREVTAEGHLPLPCPLSSREESPGTGQRVNHPVGNQGGCHGSCEMPRATRRTAPALLPRSCVRAVATWVVEFATTRVPFRPDSGPTSRTVSAAPKAPVLRHRWMPESALGTSGRVYVSNRDRGEIVSVQ